MDDPHAEEHQEESIEEQKQPLEILLEALPAEQRASVVDAWHTHVRADPQSIAAQWALIHFSLVAGMRDNTTRVSKLRTEFLKIQEGLERKGEVMNSEFRLEDAQTAAKMGDYLKIIEEGSQANSKTKKELEAEIEVLRGAVGVIQKAGNDARESIDEMRKTMNSYLSMTAMVILFLVFIFGAVAGVWFATR